MESKSCSFLGQELAYQNPKSSKEASVPHAKGAGGQGRGPDEESCQWPALYLDGIVWIPTPIAHAPREKDHMSRVLFLKHSFKTYPDTKRNIKKKKSDNAPQLVNLGRLTGKRKVDS